MGGCQRVRPRQSRHRLAGIWNGIQFGERMDTNMIVTVISAKRPTENRIVLGTRLRFFALVLISFCAALPWNPSKPVFGQVYPGGPLTPLSEFVKESRFSGSLAPNALFSPEYCDSDSLRNAATIRAIRFGDSLHGVAVGDHGAILMTHDGGRTWDAPPQNPQASGRRVECQLSDAAWISRRRIIAVGGGVDAVTGISRGVVLISHDAGESWSESQGSDFPCFRSLIQQTRFQPANSRAGSPKNIIACSDVDPVSGATYFESSDGGIHWQSLPDELLGQTLGSDTHVPPHHDPLTALSASQWSKATSKPFAVRTSCRLKDQTILCGGDHGLILRSEDQGRTWETVHGGQATCAVLVIASSPQTMPWSLIGRESLEHRLRVNVVIASLQNTASRFAVEQAAMCLGAVATDWCIDQQTQSTPTESLRGWIDTHRAKVVAIDSEFPSDVKTDLMQHAVSQGAQRVIEYSRTQRGESLLHRSAMLPGSGVLAGDFDADSVLLAGDATISPDNASHDDASHDDAPRGDGIFVQSKYHAGSHRARGVMMADGVMIPPSGRLPARSSKVSRRRLQVVQGRLKQDAAIEELIQAHGKSNAEKLAVSVDALLDQTSRVDQFRLAWSIATKIASRQDASVVWRAVAKRFPNSSASRMLLLHAGARQASIEWSAHRTSDDRQPAPIAFEATPSEIQQASQLVPSGHGHQAPVSPFQSAHAFANETQPPKQTAEKKDERRWMVQCGSFKGAEQAETVRAQLAFEGFNSRITTNNGWNRVVIGPVKGKENADNTISRLKVAGHTNCIRLATGG